MTFQASPGLDRKHLKTKIEEHNRAKYDTGLRSQGASVKSCERDARGGTGEMGAGKG